MKKWCGPDPNVSEYAMTHPVWFLWDAVNNHYVLPPIHNPVRAFIMLLAQEVPKSQKPLLTVPQKGVSCQTYWAYLYSYLSIRVSHHVKGSHNQMGNGNGNILIRLFIGHVIVTSFSECECNARDQRLQYKV